jgi:sugar/nucleoside kinase (ribokinase family)
VKNAGGVLLNSLCWASAVAATPSTLLARLPPAQMCLDARIIYEAMRRLGVATSSVICDPFARTASSYVFTTGDGERTVIMDPAATSDVTARMFHEEKNWADAIACSTVCATEISQLPLLAAKELLRLGRGHGAITAVDIDVGPEEGQHFYGSMESLLELLSFADVAKTSFSVALSICRVLGAPSLSDHADVMTVARSLQAAISVASPPVLLVTHGALPTAGILHDGTVVSLAPPVPPCLLVDGAGRQVLDSTGAGDAFSGGCYAWMHAHGAVPGDERTLREMIGIGNALGSMCVGIANSALPPSPSPAFNRSLANMHPALETLIQESRFSRSTTAV